LLGEAAYTAALAALRQQAEALNPSSGGIEVAADLTAGCYYRVQVRPGRPLCRVVNILPPPPPRRAAEADYAAALVAYLRHMLTTHHTSTCAVFAPNGLNHRIRQVYVTLSTLDPRQEQKLLRQRGQLDQVALAELDTRAADRCTNCWPRKNRWWCWARRQRQNHLSLLPGFNLRSRPDRDRPDLAAERLGLEPDAVPLPIFSAAARVCRLSARPGNQKPGGRQRASLLLDYLNGYFQRWQLNLPADFFARQLTAGRCLLLLDGPGRSGRRRRTRPGQRARHRFCAAFGRQPFCANLPAARYTGAAAWAPTLLPAPCLILATKNMNALSPTGP